MDILDIQCANATKGGHYFDAATKRCLGIRDKLAQAALLLDSGAPVPLTMRDYSNAKFRRVFPDKISTQYLASVRHKVTAELLEYLLTE